MKYIICWNEDSSFITEYKEVEDNYELKTNEYNTTKSDYLLNKIKYEEKKKQRTNYNSKEVHTLLLMKERSSATEKIVELIKENHIFKTTRSDEKSEMWVYKEGIFIPEGRTAIKEACRIILEEAHTNHITNEVISKIEADTYINTKDFFNLQNKFPYLIPVKNGQLNLRTMELYPHNSGIPFFNKINADYKPGADCPKIKQFLKEVLENEEDFKTIQELIGFCLVRDYTYERAFMFFGAHGRNGKSKLLELITRFIGVENVSGVSLQDIEKDSFAISNLHNKLVNISADLSKEALSNTGNFKSLTGRDTVSANRKFKERLDFINYAKMIYASNELPRIYTISDAFWQRWTLIQFPNRFLSEKEYNALTPEEKENARIGNPKLINEITEENELNGLLNFAIEGLERLEQKRDFSQSKLARDTKKTWERLSNSVASFIEDKIETDWDSYIIKSDFLKEYQHYCKTHKISVLSDKAIKSTLKDSLGISEGRPYSDGSQLSVWNNIKWKN